MDIKELFKSEIQVINIGLNNFKESLDRAGFKSVNVDWSPPEGGDIEILELLEKFETIKTKIDVYKANEEAVNRVLFSKPKLVGMAKAIDVIPGMKKNMILHAGPPITWERMCGPMKGAIFGAIFFEGLAKNEREAEEMIKNGEIEFSPCHNHQAVGPMAGVISPNMSVYIVENETYGNKAFSPLNDEGVVKSLRMGAYTPEVIERLKWMEQNFYPAIDKAIRYLGSIDLKAIIAQALHMGDEGHSRHKASTSLLFRILAPAIVKTTKDSCLAEQILKSIDVNDFTFLNLSMAAAKVSLDAARNIYGSTMVVAMARNGVEFGIQISGLGDEWFTAKAEIPTNALYFGKFTKEVANPDIGDSSITETYGLGAFALACSPTFIQFVKGTVNDAIYKTQMMYEITLKENNVYQIPFLNFRGTPTGIDIKLVLEKGIVPFIDTAIAHKEPNIGIIGAGFAQAPFEVFKKAMTAYIQRYSYI
ncbi:MAG: DUF1116 domain-containing protein [Caldisericia bacterium]|jgi:hypothetical protein|nr:DUF1116 domain-containing protein [Caldisericia bacterium]